MGKFAISDFIRIELHTDRLPCSLPKGRTIESYVYGISRAKSKLGAEVHLVVIEARSYGQAHYIL